MPPALCQPRGRLARKLEIDLPEWPAAPDEMYVPFAGTRCQFPEAGYRCSEGGFGVFGQRQRRTPAVEVNLPPIDRPVILEAYLREPHRTATVVNDLDPNFVRRLPSGVPAMESRMHAESGPAKEPPGEACCGPTGDQEEGEDAKDLLHKRDRNGRCKHGGGSDLTPD